MTLVFDTETTGRADFSRPPEDACQPRLVQLGAILYGDDRKVRAEVNLIVKPQGFTIPQDAVDVHGISTETALACGVNCKAVLLLFKALCEKASVLVAHNIQYDGIIVAKERHVQQVQFQAPQPFCTMLGMKDVCRIPGKYKDFKWPSLQEAHRHAFGRGFDGAHDAMVDVRACAAVYWWLQDHPDADQVRYENTLGAK